MECVFWKEEVRKGFFIILLILAVFQGTVFSQKPDHFYNVDTEKKIRGTIQKIVMESRYKDASPFLIVVLEEKKTEVGSYRLSLLQGRREEHHCPPDPISWRDYHAQG